MARAARAITKDIQSYIKKYSRYHQSVLSIEQFTHFGKTASVKESFSFLRFEVPIRLAHIMQEINHLPKVLLQTPSVELVKSWYVQSFVDLMDFLNDDFSEDDIERFTDTLYTIKQRHDKTVETMAQGVIELKSAQNKFIIDPKMQYFLDRFYMNRIGIRLLMTNHIALFGKHPPSSGKFIGVFEPNCRIKKVLEDAVAGASDLCARTYFDSPMVKINEHGVREGEDEVIAAYVPSHLHFMLFELLKNAMRATVEKHEAKDEIPDINIDIVKGNEDLTIRISDLGGGICRNKIKDLFTYHYSTAPEPDQLEGMAPLAGYGYGLPLSKLYAKYFGGDIHISSLEGLGSDTFVYLKALSQDAQEVIPMYNSLVAKEYEEIDQETVRSSQREWSCDSFYDGQIRSYSKPFLRSSGKKNGNGGGSRGK
ncbi:pyruvate dehydrogenase (acetyl-transferring) kinase isozyme 2, mitochondrial-like isoform X1 [Clytia hemisphaerica]|uniref:Protein-serine/threonine kinase n=2 Tax=Clytia hemisphaerica TaxID=252671 RepID=A0A7M5VAH9_9CNID